MNSKIGWFIFFISWFSSSQLSAQLDQSDNLANRFIRFGIGGSNFGSELDLYSLDFELGYKSRINPHFSTSVLLNFGLGLDEDVEADGLQSHLSWACLFSPFRNNEKFLFNLGGGLSTLGVYDANYWRQTESGVFPGFCVVVETGFFSEKRNKTYLMNIHWGYYTSSQSQVGVSLIRQVTTAQIKRDRERVKRKFH